MAENRGEIGRLLDADMKRLPPRPQMRLHLEKHNPVTLQTFYGILYRFDINNKWENVIQDYIKIDLLDYQCPESRYTLEAVSGDQKILNYTITSSTKVSLKGAFVRWNHDTTVHGARFSKPNVAEEFCDQVSALSMDLLSKLQGTSEKTVVDMGSRKASTASVNSSSAINSAQQKVSTVLIEILLNNGELRQLYVDKETTASDLFDKICKDEKLSQSFYSLNYMAPPNSPLPSDCQVANLDSYKLRLFDTKDLQKSVSSDTRKTQPEGRFSTVPRERSVKNERKISYMQEEKDFILEASDPLVKAFLELANIHQYELKKPRVHSIVEDFIASRGGLLYLKQLRDSKLSRQVLDEIGDIAQRVLSLAESPTKSSHQYKRVSSVRDTGSNSGDHFDLRRAYSVGHLSPRQEMETKKSFASKKKRQAPLPPGQAMAPVRTSSLPSHSSTDSRADGAKSADLLEPPRVKRRAPLPPTAAGGQHQAVSPPLLSNTSANATPTARSASISPASPLDGDSTSSHGEVIKPESRDSLASPNDQDPAAKSPPTFLAPPPPNDSPPNEVYSPVEPVSATTPSPTKEFKFMGELARKLEARRSLIVHSDDDDWTENQSTPKKEHGASKGSTPSGSLFLSPNHTPREEDTRESTPVKVVQDSCVKSVKMENMNGIAEEESATSAVVHESQQSSDCISNRKFVAEEKKKLYLNEEEERKELDSTPSDNTTPGQDSAEIGLNTAEINAGYTVQLLEDQMRTISHSIRLLQDVKDDKQREVLLKPLLLQQQILQKMIDQETVDMTDKLATDIGSHSNRTNEEILGANKNVPRRSTLLRTGSVDEKPSKEVISELDSDALNSKEHWNDDLAQKSDTLVKDIVSNRKDVTEVKKLKYYEEQKNVREEDVNQKREEMHRREVEEMQKKKEEERQKEIDEERRRYEEQKRHMENEKLKKIELERQKKEEQEKLNRQKKKVELFENEQQKTLQDESQKLEEYRKIEEERKRAEHEKQEIELARKQREEERVRLEKEVLQLRVEEQQRKEQEAKRKMEELKQLERLRKELETEKRIENERLENERKEIEDLKRQLKEQREMQKREALERKALEDKKLNETELPAKRIDEEQHHGESRAFVEERKLEIENSVSHSNKAESKFKETFSSLQSDREDSLVKEVGQIDSKTIDLLGGLHAAGANTDASSVAAAHHSSASFPAVKPTARSATDAKPESKQSGSMRRPSSNLVSSAIRTAEGETSKKPTVGLFAKIQQMANERSNATSVVDRKPENLQQGDKEKKLSNVNNQITQEQTVNSVKDPVSCMNTQTEMKHEKDPCKGIVVLPSKDIRSETTKSPTNYENEDSIIIADHRPGDEQRRRQKKISSPVGTDTSSIEDSQNISVMRDLNGVDKPNGGLDGNKYQGTRAIDSTTAKLCLDKPGSKENALVGREASEQPKITKHPSGAISKDTSFIEIGQSEVYDSHAGKEAPKKPDEAASEVEPFPTKSIYLSGFSSWSSFADNEKKGANDDILEPEGFDIQGQLGNYRPKCISPDDLRSTLVLEKDEKVGSNQNSASSASILKNAIGKKVPPKVLPKTLPKTLPKPGSKVGGTSENVAKRESIKSRIEDLNRRKPDAKEKKRDYINIAAIPNRSLEISSGTISSNIMNKNILQDEKRGHLIPHSGERARTLPCRPKTGEAVASEPVQAPSLLRRLSQNSLYTDTTKANQSPNGSPGLEIEPEKTEKNLVSQISSSDEVNSDAVEINVCESAHNTEVKEPVRVGNYASVMDINENEKMQRDTIPVKKVGGLNIGFGRDKPKVYHR